MFCRAGRIVDIFIPINKVSGLSRCCAFVRFTRQNEAERAEEMAKGRSWGGRKLQVNMARYHSRGSNQVDGKSRFHKEVEDDAGGSNRRRNLGLNGFGQQSNDGNQNGVAGRIVDDGVHRGKGGFLGG